MGNREMDKETFISHLMLLGFKKEPFEFTTLELEVFRKTNKMTPLGTNLNQSLPPVNISVWILEDKISLAVHNGARPVYNKDSYLFYQALEEIKGWTNENNHTTC